MKSPDKEFPKMNGELELYAVFFPRTCNNVTEVSGSMTVHPQSPAHAEVSAGFNDSQCFEAPLPRHTRRFLAIRWTHRGLPVINEPRVKGELWGLRNRSPGAWGGGREGGGSIVNHIKKPLPHLGFVTVWICVCKEKRNILIKVNHIGHTRLLKMQWFD